MNKAKIYSSLLILAVLLAHAKAARGEEDDSDLESLLSNQVVSTVSKGAETADTAPGTSTSITAEELRSYGIRTVNEAVDFLSVGVMSSPGLTSSQIGSRGLILRDGGEHVLVLVDGHAINEPFKGSSITARGIGVPLELVDHIEVVVGPGSILYGSGAMFGVINILTKKASDFKGTHVVAESEIPTTNRVGAGVGYELKPFDVPLELTFEADYFRRRGPDLTYGPQNVGSDPATGRPYATSRFTPATGIWGGTATNFAQDIPQGYLRLRSGHFDLGVRAALIRRINSPGTSAFDDPDSVTTDRYLSLDLKHELPISAIVQLNSRLYGDIYDSRGTAVSAQQFCAAPSPSGFCESLTDRGSRQIGAEVRSSFDWFTDGSLVTMIGTDARTFDMRNSVNLMDASSQAQLQGTDSVFSKATGAVGAYVQQTWQPLSWFGLNLGARTDYDPRFSAPVSPRASAFVKGWHGNTIKLTYSQAYRAPSWVETNVSAYNRALPDHLVPETVEMVEASISQAIHTHRLFLAAFDSNWGDLVGDHHLTTQEAQDAFNRGLLPNAPSGTRTISQYRNNDRIRSYGLSAGVDGSLDTGRFRYGLSVTGARTRLRAATNSAEVTPQLSPDLFGNAAVSYALRDGFPVLALAARYVSRRIADVDFGAFNSDPTAPPDLELRGTISGPAPWVQGLSYRLLGDYSLATHGAGTVGPLKKQSPTLTAPELAQLDGFRVMVGLQYDFAAGE